MESAFLYCGVHSFPSMLPLLSHLSRQGAALVHFDSLPLMIWCFGRTALFPFLLTKTAPAFIPTARSVALRPLFSFQQAQYAQVLPLMPAPFCKLFAGFGSTIKCATFLLFFYLTLALSFSPSFLLPQSLCRNCFLSPPVLTGYNGFSNTRFSRGTMSCS